MNRTLLQTIGTAALCAVLCTDAYATSGWDNHQIDVDGQYRIHGKRGESFVQRLDNTGRPIDPPLCSTRDHSGLHGPPDYAVTSTHLVLRYQVSNEPEPDPATAQLLRDSETRRSSHRPHDASRLTELSRHRIDGTPLEDSAHPIGMAASARDHSRYYSPQPAYSGSDYPGSDRHVLYRRLRDSSAGSPVQLSRTSRINFVAMIQTHRRNLASQYSRRDASPLD